MHHPRATHRIRSPHVTTTPLRTLGGMLVVLSSVSALSAAVVGCASKVEVDVADSEGELRSANAPIDHCPVKFELANGVACTENLSCLYSIDCGATPQQTHCSCVSGKLECVDRVGPIPVGAKQLCAPSTAADSSECPPTRAAANGKQCFTVGRMCAYRGSYCPVTGVEQLDWCKCHPDGEGGYQYVCESALCPRN